MSLNDINSLSHTKWNCKYHIVFAPKYRRKVFVLLLFNRCMCFSVFLYGSGFLFALIIQYKGGM